MTQEFVTLPRDVVEQALEALLNEGNFRKLRKTLIEESIKQIKAALEQPQNHAPDFGNMVQAGWKLVPVEPNEEMLRAGCGSESPAIFRESLRHETDGPKTAEMVKKIVQRHLESYRAMLDAAPQPPTTEQSSVVDQTEPAYLLRDLADDISVDALDLIAAIRDAGLGYYSVNMMLPAKVCVAMCQRFSAVGRRPVARVAGTGHLGGHFDWCVPGNQGVPRGTLLCIHPQNLNCKSTQARLATLWGYVKEQPQGEQESVAVIGDVWTLNWVGGDPIATIVKKHGLKIGTKLYTHPQNLRCKSTQARLATLWGYVKAEPLTDEQIAAATGAKPGTPMWLVAVAFARAIEAAHNIK